jgi:hypothetical protein
LAPYYNCQEKSTTHVQIDDNQSETTPAVHAGSYNSLCAWMIRAFSRAQRVGKLQKQSLVSTVSFQNLPNKKKPEPFVMHSFPNVTCKQTTEPKNHTPKKSKKKT